MSFLSSYEGPGTLERAVAIASLAHEGQVDKAGAPYILHPLRVMSSQVTTEAQIVAVLHDTVEDTDVTLADLADNLNALRLKQFDAKAAERFSKYLAAYRFLSHADSPRGAR